MQQLIIPGLEIPVGNIFCIGRNYSEHAKEMGNVVPTAPIVFTKPTNTLCFSGDVVCLPAQSKEVHHEVELVAAIGMMGKNIHPDHAMKHVAGLGIGIDFTARDIQQAAKEKGHPWSVAKGFDHFAPISSFISMDELDQSLELELSLYVNGTIRQKGNTRDMIFKLNELISHLSGIFTLRPGDLIFTGTPSGVSAIQTGDHIEAVLHHGLCSLSVTIL